MPPFPGVTLDDTPGRPAGAAVETVAGAGKGIATHGGPGGPAIPVDAGSMAAGLPAGSGTASGPEAVGSWDSTGHPGGLPWPARDAAPAAGPSPADGPARPSSSFVTHTLAPDGVAGGGRRGGGEGNRGADGRRRAVLWSVAAVLVVAAAGGTYLTLAHRDSGAPGSSSQRPGPHPTTTKADPSASSSPSTPPSPPPVPDGFRLAKEPDFGVSFPVPEGWRRNEKPDHEQIDYVDPSGVAQLTISVMDLAGKDQVAHFKELESTLKGQYEQVERLRLNSTTFLGRPAAVWEFKFLGETGWYRATDLGFGFDGEEEYAIYLSAPEDRWGDFSPVFRVVREGFRIDADQAPSSRP